MDEETTTVLHFSSDSNDDPTPAPENENVLKKKRAIPDFFGVRNLKKVSFASVSDRATPSTSANSENSISSGILTVCDDKLEKYLCLDGKFFKPTDINKNEKKIQAECQLRLPKDVNIKRVLGVLTNF
ncbi:hypothetical protein ILUMI_00281 [Ignelater luminosus]|uniref:Uncharacterized protein n=1 Tax=Ignelater luminosus TaxID=2038154 RepID=A0A8K0DKI9_IGNLU|nr:hypothetical protein ILUMI_00281 [Ignelater luminosus]